MDLLMISYLFFNNLDMFRNPYVVIGDFNVDVLKKNANSNYLIDLFKSFNLHLKNILPTRIGKSCSSLIDLVFYNDTLKAIDNLVTTTISILLIIMPLSALLIK